MSDLVAALRRNGVGDVDDSDLARAMYSSDASLYRVPPRLVVRPRAVDEIEAVLAVAREHRSPVTMRGAGTSIAGNAVGPGIVVDTSRHLNRVLELDPGSRLPALAPDLAADLTTVVGNLVDNAVDASAGAGEPAVELWIHADDEAVHVRVRDARGD